VGVLFERLLCSISSAAGSMNDSMIYPTTVLLKLWHHVSRCSLFLIRYGWTKGRRIDVGFEECMCQSGER
jgi:hypothetical protein